MTRPVKDQVVGKGQSRQSNVGVGKVVAAAQELFWVGFGQWYGRYQVYIRTSLNI